MKNEHAQAMARARWKNASEQDRADQADRIRAVTRRRKRRTTAAERSEAARHAAQSRWQRRNDIRDARAKACHDAQEPAGDTNDGDS